MIPDAAAAEAGVDAMLAAAGEGASPYIAVMLGPLAAAGEDGLMGAMHSGAEVRQVDASERTAMLAAIADAADRATQFDGYRLHADDEARAARAADTPEGRARLVGIARGDLPPLRPGERIPYVRFDVLPTIAQTARLWTLNDKQAVAFAIAADVLRREACGEAVDEPLRLLLTGKAGTGKSRVLQALQWYALQLEGADMLAVVAYTWRAALLLGTPDNPACTTTTFFAIDSVGAEHHGGVHKLRSSGKVRGNGRKFDT